MNKTWLITSELANQRARKVLFTCVVYTNLLYGLPKEQIAKMQRVQNAAARLVMDIGKYSHIAPALYELHTLASNSRAHSFSDSAAGV